jgi:VanZ family protein
MLSLPHGRILLAVGWALILLTIVGSLGPPLPGGGFSISDKALHFIGYFALTLWFAGLYERERLWTIGIAFFCLGGALELLQGALTASRQMDVVDVAANSLGIAAAIAVAALGLSSWALRLEAFLTRRGKESA